ncbi:hypothetical protein BDR07DRAFT_639765 [Suillus spraguei]|nr:hypothetical protein BDR07DRAFT_639765 [Suillus spraguei]
MISGSRDNTIRRWDLREGKEIEKVREVCKSRIEVGLSRDGRWVVTAGREEGACSLSFGSLLRACLADVCIFRHVLHRAATSGRWGRARASFGMPYAILIAKSMSSETGCSGVPYLFSLELLVLLATFCAPTHLYTLPCIVY